MSVCFICSLQVDEWIAELKVDEVVKLNMRNEFIDEKISTVRQLIDLNEMYIRSLTDLKDRTAVQVQNDSVRIIAAIKILVSAEQ